MVKAKKIKQLGRVSLLIMGGFFSSFVVCQAATIFQDDFEAGNYSSWDFRLQNENCNSDTAMTVNQSSMRKGTYGLDIHYVMDDDPRGDCDPHQDNNTSLTRVISPPRNHYFFRGYFKFPMSQQLLCNTPTIQRKLIYFKPENYDYGGWSFFINSWPWGVDCNSNGYNISLAYGDGGGMRETLWGDDPNNFNTVSNHIMAGVWYYIEVEVEYGTYDNDRLVIWLAQDGQSPVKIFERSDLDLRSPSDVSGNYGLGYIELGRQVDVTRTCTNGIIGEDEGEITWGECIVDPSGFIDEHRYWDDIVFADEYIGLVESQPDTTAPASPSGLSVR